MFDQLVAAHSAGAFAALVLAAVAQRRWCRYHDQPFGGILLGLWVMLAGIGVRHLVAATWAIGRDFGIEAPRLLLELASLSMIAVTVLGMAMLLREMTRLWILFAILIVAVWAAALLEAVAF